MIKTIIVAIGVSVVVAAVMTGALYLIMEGLDSEEFFRTDDNA